MPTQLVTRVPDPLAERIDRLVDSGLFGSRSEVVREALEALLEREHRASIGAAIVEGYRRVSQDGDDLAWNDAATAAMVAEEPW